MNLNELFAKLQDFYSRSTNRDEILKNVTDLNSYILKTILRVLFH